VLSDEVDAAGGAAEDLGVALEAGAERAAGMGGRYRGREGFRGAWARMTWDAEGTREGERGGRGDECFSHL
jgi:hypothetical protein